MSYNGWTNYETWAVSLWLTNEYFSQKFMEKKAEEIYEMAKNKNEAIYELASFIGSRFDDWFPDVDGLFSDLLRHAIDKVDYGEIAESYIEAIEDEKEEEE